MLHWSLQFFNLKPGDTGMVIGAILSKSTHFHSLSNPLWLGGIDLPASLSNMIRTVPRMNPPILFILSENLPLD